MELISQMCYKSNLKRIKTKLSKGRVDLNQSSTTFSAIKDYINNAPNNNKHLKYALQISRKYLIASFLEYYISKKKINMI